MFAQPLVAFNFPSRVAFKSAKHRSSWPTRVYTSTNTPYRGQRTFFALVTSKLGCRQPSYLRLLSILDEASQQILMSDHILGYSASHHCICSVKGRFPLCSLIILAGSAFCPADHNTELVYQTRHSRHFHEQPTNTTFEIEDYVAKSPSHLIVLCVAEDRFDPRFCYFSSSFKRSPLHGIPPYTNDFVLRFSPSKAKALLCVSSITY